MSMMELFAKTVNSFYPLTFLRKKQDLKYADVPSPHFILTRPGQIVPDADHQTDMEIFSRIGKAMNKL